MKKIVWIHIKSYRPNGDAPANRAFAFANYLSSRDYKVNIITCGLIDEIERRPEATIYRLKNKYHYKKKTFINRFFDNYVFSIKTSYFIKTHKKDFFDTFFIVSLPDYIAAISCIKSKRFGAKLIVDVRDIWPEVAIEMGAFRQKSIMSYIFKHYAKKYYDKCDYLITVTNKKTAHLREITKHKKDDRIVWVGNGFDLDSVKEKKDYSVIKCIHNLNEKFVVSYVGNIGKAQHLISLLEYARNTKNFKEIFIISGTGSELDYLKQYAKKYNLKNVIFTNSVTKEQAQAILEVSSISFVALSSSKMVDSVPTKLFESLGLGIPVLLVANGEACDILNETKLGMSISPDNIADLPNCFKLFEDNYKQIVINKTNCINIIRNNYSRQKYCQTLLDLFEKEL